VVTAENALQIVRANNHCIDTGEACGLWIREFVGHVVWLVCLSVWVMLGSGVLQFSCRLKRLQGACRLENLAFHRLEKGLSCVHVSTH